MHAFFTVCMAKFPCLALLLSIVCNSLYCHSFRSLFYWVIFYKSPRKAPTMFIVGILSLIGFCLFFILISLIGLALRFCSVLFFIISPTSKHICRLLCKQYRALRRRSWNFCCTLNCSGVGSSNMDNFLGKGIEHNFVCPLIFQGSTSAVIANGVLICSGNTCWRTNDDLCYKRFMEHLAPAVGLLNPAVHFVGSSILLQFCAKED